MGKGSYQHKQGKDRGRKHRRGSSVALSYSAQKKRGKTAKQGKVKYSFSMGFDDDDDDDDTGGDDDDDDSIGTRQ